GGLEDGDECVGIATVGGLVGVHGRERPKGIARDVDDPGRRDAQRKDRGVGAEEVRRVYERLAVGRHLGDEVAVWLGEIEAVQRIYLRKVVGVRRSRDVDVGRTVQCDRGNPIVAAAAQVGREDELRATGVQARD